MAKINPFEIKINGTTLELLAKQAAKAFKDIEQYFREITVRDNFFREIWEGQIAAGAESKIRHTLEKVPEGYLILSDTSAAVGRGPTQWTTEFVYLKNNHSTDVATVKVAILG